MLSTTADGDNTGVEAAGASPPRLVLSGFVSHGAALVWDPSGDEASGSISGVRRQSRTQRSQPIDVPPSYAACSDVGGFSPSLLGVQSRLIVASCAFVASWSFNVGLGGPCAWYVAPLSAMRLGAWLVHLCSRRALRRLALRAAHAARVAAFLARASRCSRPPPRRKSSRRTSTQVPMRRRTRASSRRSSGRRRSPRTEVKGCRRRSRPQSVLASIRPRQLPDM